MQDTRNTIRRSVRGKCFVSFAVPEVSLDDIPLGGMLQFSADRDEFFGGNKSEPYLSPVVDSPTWLKICQLCNQQIKITRDFHHVFLEGITIKDRKDGVIMMEFILGS